MAHMYTLRCALLCAMILLVTRSVAQPLSFRPVLNIGDVKTGDTLGIALMVDNAASSSVWISAIEYFDAYPYRAMSVDPRIADSVIESGNATGVALTIAVRHNVPLRGHLQFTVQVGCAEYKQLMFITGNATARDTRYARTDAKDYDSLYAVLQSMTVNHTSLGYKSGREVMFGKADNVRDSVECIYTGRKLRTAGIPPNGEFNTEHTWVQSRGSSNEPNRSDINHLYPTYPRANSIRANYPFGSVAKQLTDAEGGSRLGITATGDTVFEPRAVSRGNIARSIFYYLVRYGNVTGYYTSPYSMDATLRQWNAQDPPDARERTRCDTIAAYQGKRNPFVDIPEFAERLNFLGAAPLRHPVLLPHNVRFNPDDTMLLTSHIFNPLPVPRTITGITLSHPSYIAFENIGNDTTLGALENRRFSMRIKPSNPSPPARMLVALSFSDGTADTITFSNCSLLSVASSADVEPPVTVIPHPVRGVARIESSIPYSSLQSITLHSVNGVEVADLHPLAESSSNGVSIQLDTTGLSNGVYLLHIRTATMHITRMIVALRD
ncbi:MAG: endonuclease [Candidatus Kapabacteria bacterium]|nr:endonuclease [Candidatus Kapabacteria bacterium]